MKNFITVTMPPGVQRKNPSEVKINVEHVVVVEAYTQGVVIRLVGGISYTPIETYEQVIDLLSGKTNGQGYGARKV